MVIFLTICNTLFPLMMVIFGFWMNKYPPQNINVWFGYRTEASMRSKETWLFAHRYAGRYWFILGLVMLIINGIVMGLLIWFFRANEELFGTLSLVWMLLEMIPLLSVIYTTEKALKRKF